MSQKKISYNLMKSICFLFSGQARVSPFSIKKNKRNQDILSTYTNYIFSDEFKSKYKYKIYISTDIINVEDVLEYFSNKNIGNIHLLDTDYYFKNISERIKPVSYYLNDYEKKDFLGCRPFSKGINQHHKILDCYNLMRNDDIDNFDFVIRLRMDTKYLENILVPLKLFEQDTNLQILMSHDHFAIGKPKIMECYCTGLENNYGNYTYNVLVPSKLPIMYPTKDKLRWTYAPERQLFEMLFEYCNLNNLDINKTIRSYRFAIGTGERGIGV